MVNWKDMASVVLLAALLTSSTACGTIRAVPGDAAGSGDGATSVSPPRVLAEGEECSVTRHISLPAAGSPEATESTTAYPDPRSAAAGFVVEMLREYDTNPDLAASLERGGQLLDEQEARDGRQTSTVGTEDGAAILSAVRHRALLDLEEALNRGTVVVQEDEGSVMLYLPDGYDAASLVAVEWGAEGWVVDTLSHWLPASECME